MSALNRNDRVRGKPMLRALLLAAVAVAGQAPALHASESDEDLRFNVTTGLTAHARLRQDGMIEVATNRTPQPQKLQGAADEEGRSRLDHGDYNFDGYQDLASRASVGQVNETVVVYVYEPRTSSFRELPAPTQPTTSCEGFWSLLPDAKSRTLTSTCRSGPMWYSDVYRYNGRQLYLYRSMRLAYLETEKLDRVLSLETAEDDGPPAVWSTYNPAGQVLERAIANGLALPPHDVALTGQQATVLPSRLPLYAHAGDAATKRYLVQGDGVELLDTEEDWLKLRYRNPSRGQIVGWVKLPE